MAKAGSGGGGWCGARTKIPCAGSITYPTPSWTTFFSRSTNARDEAFWTNSSRASGVNLATVFTVTVSPKAVMTVRCAAVPRAAQVAIVEEHIGAKQWGIGDLETGEPWIAGRADLDVALLRDGQEVLWCGYAGPLLVALKGSARHLVGSASSGSRSGSFSHGSGTVILDIGPSKLKSVPDLPPRPARCISRRSRCGFSPR